MSHANDRHTATGLLDELDDIRALLDDGHADEHIPVLEDAVDPPDHDIPVLDDPIVGSMQPFDGPEAGLPVVESDSVAEFAAFTRRPAWTDLPLAPVDIPSHAPRVSDAFTERLIGQGLGAAIQARIDATLEHWVNETLQVELALLRARLQDAVKTEIEAFVSAEIRRATDKPHGAESLGE